MLGVLVRDALDEALNIGCQVMERIAPGQQFKRLTLEGNYSCNEIVLGLKTVAVIWWYKGGNKSMFIEGVAAIGNEQVTWQCIVEAVDLIAAKHGFKTVECEAVRMGMICKLKEAGYHATGVIMRRNYD